MAELFVRRKGEAFPSKRRSGDRERVIHEAAQLAKEGGEDGVMSVWVQERPGAIVWSAGEKHAQLVEAGENLDRFGGVIRENAGA